MTIKHRYRTPQHFQFHKNRKQNQPEIPISLEMPARPSIIPQLISKIKTNR